jgi:hypothetical protein
MLPEQCVGQVSACQMFVGQMSVFKMSVAQVFFDQNMWRQMDGMVFITSALTFTVKVALTQMNI